MLATTLLLACLAADGRPPRAPRPPQFPPPGAVLILAAPTACGIAGCSCGCASGDVCRCARPAPAVHAPPAFLPPPAYLPPVHLYRPAPPVHFFAGGGGGGGC